ncbi:MAG: hypothetical protein ACTSQJ_19125, partial [Promethearchaeota archaeon]
MTEKEQFKELKLKIKLDRMFHAFLDSKSWKRFWDFCQKHNINYYLHFALGKLFKKLKRKLKKYPHKYKLGDFNLYAIGQSHLDACWLWTKLSTIRRAIITFEQAVENFRRYSYFTFSQTSPQYYDWVKKLKPELFKKIQEYEKKGKWEIVGGMWIEPDTNLPNGESLVRQRLYGQLFYLENFGKIAKIECLEDSFGFNAQLPQILVKSGAEAFWTTKITWNDYTEFPFANFIWRGIDDSEIFTHLFLYNWPVLFDLSLYKRIGRRIKKPGLIFNSSCSMEQIQAQISENDYMKTLAIFYGFGDGGMGPLREEIDIFTNIARRRKADNSPLIRFITTEKYFDLLRKESKDLLPIWNDELYLELHRGVYTTISNVKKLNRMCEINLRNCEMILSLFSLFFKNFNYPKIMEVLWKDLLFNQFHDILPGSSIQDVYYEQEKEMYNIIYKTNKLISVAMQYILLSYLKKQNQINEIKDYGIVLNTLPWVRDGSISININKNIKKNIQIKNMPPISYRIINIKNLLNSKEKSSVKIESDLKLQNKLKIITIENSKLYLKINKLTGRIISLIYKETGRELIRKNNGIGIKVFKEKKFKYPAWEIYKNYTSYPVDIGIVKG